jgi:hypothetical protein
MGLAFRHIGLPADVAGLRLHPLRLGMNVAASLFQEPSLPNHSGNLQQSNENQSPCEPSESLLYLEILSALLAGLIASWGGWLWAGGSRWWGGLVAGLAVWLFLSFATAVTFGDPCFWRVGRRILTGSDPYQYEETDYRQPFMHDAENVSQKHLATGYGPVVFSREMLEKPRLHEFIKSAGSSGIVSALATIGFLAITVVEHEKSQDISADVLVVLAGISFCWGACIAWVNERKERIKLDELRGKADIRCEIYRASIDTKRFGEHGETIAVDDGICLSLLLKTINHGHDAWWGAWPEVEITFGAETYKGTLIRIPESPFVLQWDDMSLHDRRVQGLFQSFLVNMPHWPHGMPRQGTVSFIVPGVDHNIMNVNTPADIQITFFDSLENSHKKKINDIQILRGSIQQQPKA